MKSLDDFTDIENKDYVLNFLTNYVKDHEKLWAVYLGHSRDEKGNLASGKEFYILIDGYYPNVNFNNEIMEKIIKSQNKSKLLRLPYNISVMPCKKKDIKTNPFLIEPLYIKETQGSLF
jgi:hypothetical protein